MISDDVLGNKDEIKKSLCQPYLIIENALDPDFAEQLYQELNITDTWQLQDQSVKYQEVVNQTEEFSYSRKRIDMDSTNIPNNLSNLFAYLKSEECLKWISDVSGRKCNDFWGAAAAFDRGDHISEHNDHLVSRDNKGNISTRSVTFNYYLTKNWGDDWGGEFVWKKPREIIKPSFNTLVLFNVGSATDHWVEPVTEVARERRYSLTGWFLTVRNATENNQRKLSLKMK